MKIYLASLSTNHFELENKAFKTFGSSLKYIYDNFKTLSVESVKDCDFFDREYVQKYFSEEYFNKFNKVNCKSTYGEFVIQKKSSKKYQFVFKHINQDYFFVGELETLELLD